MGAAVERMPRPGATKAAPLLEIAIGKQLRIGHGGTVRARLWYRTSGLAERIALRAVDGLELLEFWLATDVTTTWCLQDALLRLVAFCKVAARPTGTGAAA